MKRSLDSGTVQDVDQRLRSTGYLPQGNLAAAVFLSLQMSRPLLLEGEPGTGKTALAEAIAEAWNVPLIRLQCYEGIDASQALYDWDFPRQVLRLRAAVAHEPSDHDASGMQREDGLYGEEFLLERPILTALRKSPAVLLIDEIDRADDEFEAFLLEVLSTFQVSIPELGTVRAETPPVVVLTSNRTRELHDALKRRCLYHWVSHPPLEREVEIIQSRAPEVADALTRQVASIVAQLREDQGLIKPPGVAESLDWARALHRLGAAEVDLEFAAMSLGALVKYREDDERVRDALANVLR